MEPEGASMISQQPTTYPYLTQKIMHTDFNLESIKRKDEL